MYPTPAFYRAFRDQVSTSVGYAVVDLAPGADADAVRRCRPTPVRDADGIAVQAGFEGGAPGRDAIGVQVIALLVVGAVVAIGGCVVIAQWVAATASTASSDVEQLRSIGTTRRQRAAAISLALAPAAAAGAVLAGVGHVLASPLMPVGYARRLEPNPGSDFDWTVPTAGVTALAAVVVLSATVSAWRAARHRRVTNRPAPAGRHGRLFSSLPAPVALGLTAGTWGPAW